jgi:hypothetical protein
MLFERAHLSQRPRLDVRGGASKEEFSQPPRYSGSGASNMGSVTIDRYSTLFANRQSASNPSAAGFTPLDC